MKIYGVQAPSPVARRTVDIVAISILTIGVRSTVFSLFVFRLFSKQFRLLNLSTKYVQRPIGH